MHSIDINHSFKIKVLSLVNQLYILNYSEVVNKIVFKIFYGAKI